MKNYWKIYLKNGKVISDKSCEYLVSDRYSYKLYKWGMEYTEVEYKRNFFLKKKPIETKKHPKSIVYEIPRENVLYVKYIDGRKK